MTDIEIVRSTKIETIDKIAKKIQVEDIEIYGKYKCKINSTNKRKDGKIILVTATTPTPYGEGKTTVSIGLVDALNQMTTAIGSLREPSLGPVFGLKGGACGGGYAQVIPMEDINLHFTGDMHAITAANNLLCAAIDNHIKQGNALEIEEVTFHRCLDVNDRVLKNVILDNGRKEKFSITAASEIMAIICLAKNIADLRIRLEQIIIGINKKGKPIFAKDLQIAGSLLVLLKDAIKPNLVQTLEHNPILIHGGPFANIACGCSSIISLDIAKGLADYVVTEAGFGSDCGAIKYFDIVSRSVNVKPNVVVIVTTIKALEYCGKDNLEAHINIVKRFTNNIVVALNRFANDTEEQINDIKSYCESFGISFSVCTAYSDGGQGALDLAKQVIQISQRETSYETLYKLEDSIEDKINKIAKDLYHANNVQYSEESKKSISFLTENGFAHLPICIAKTQYSISDNKNKLGSPKDYTITVKNIELKNGAGFLVIYLGNILTMPGLPKEPNYEKIDIDDRGICGLF